MIIAGRRIPGLVAVTALVAATGILAAPEGFAAAPAQAAAACPTATGVTAVVDFAELGGGVTAGCDPDGGDQAASVIFRDAGYTLEYSQQPGMNGFVCKVQGKPADGDCAANDAFWSLWWSDGESGRWVFSNRGVATLDIPDGGYVAFAWHEGDGHAQPPAVNPTPHESPDPTDEPTTDDGGNDGGSNGGDNGGNQGGNNDNGATTTAASTSAATTSATTSASASDSASPGRGKKRRDRESTDATSTATSSTVPGAEDITAGPPSSDVAYDPSDDDGGVLATWIGLGLAGVVLGAAGVVTVLRRRTG